MENVNENINENHSRVSLSGIFNVCCGRAVQKQQSVEDPRLQISGMAPLFNNSKHAFTLIELLVVVLIIGILSAIALPQYQTVVAKARYVQLMTAGNALRQAQLRYRLANGEFATDFADLDIELPGTRETALRWQGSNYGCYMALSNGGFSYLWCTNSNSLA